MGIGNGFFIRNNRLNTARKAFNQRSFLFISHFSFLISHFLSCASPQSQIASDFYLGLNSDNAVAAVSYYEKALSSGNEYIRRAAANELASLMANGTPLSARTVQRIRSEARGSWAQALKSAGNKEAALAFLLNIDSGVPNDARLYVLKETESLFSEKEFAAINGHYAVSRARYNEALLFFRVFQEGEGGAAREWPLFLPDLFVKYPGLINDLGRAFQYTSSGAEGADVFLRWERNLAGGADTRSFSRDFLSKARYGLLFYAGRVARRANQNARAIPLFEQSLELAPDKEQTDACVWYLLDLALRDSHSAFLACLERYIPFWHNNNYYDDILERILQTFAEKKEWDKIAEVYELIKHTNASVKAGYAWILCRVIEEGYKTQIQLGDKEEYLNSAYNAGSFNMPNYLYYRGLAASALNKPFLQGLFLDDVQDDARRARAPAPAATPALQFINGFFEHNAESRAQRYIYQFDAEFSFDELRAAAGALENAGMYVQAIRLVYRYSGREDFPGFTKRDIELLYPIPFKDIVERNAREFNITPEILFALILTESAFQSAVISSAGAVGLTQLMPETAQDMAARIRRAGGPDYAGANLDPADPEQNIYIGAYYLNYLMDRFENMLISLLSYNGGMNRIRNRMNIANLPDDLFMESLSITETRWYGRKVLGAAEVYKALYY